MVIAASAPPGPALGARLSSHAMSNDVTRAFLEGTRPRFAGAVAGVHSNVGTTAAKREGRRGTPPGARANRPQVSWLAGLGPSPPSRVTPVAWHGLAAYSCGGSCGIGNLRSSPHSL